MTSLAANNVLPLRIGDVMRIFTYAGDMNATPSMVLSTVILEKLLDVFSLAVFFVASLEFGGRVAPHMQAGGADPDWLISVAGLLVMVLGARALEQPLREIFAKTKSSKLEKVEHWVMLALDCIRQIGVGGTLLLVVYSLAAWTCECLHVYFDRKDDWDGQRSRIGSLAGDGGGESFVSDSELAGRHWAV